MIPKPPRVVVLLWVAVALHAPPVRAQKSPTAQVAFTRAQQQLVAGHYAEAATEMETAVRYEPRFAMGWYVLASAARRAGQCDQAVFAYRRYMELRPNEPDPYFGTGLCLQTLGDTLGAAIAFRQYVAMDIRPTSREFVDIAKKHMAELERSAAAEKSTPRKPAPPQLLEARKHREQGRVNDAIASYKAAITADPQLSDGHAELGALLIAAKRPREALDALRTAVRLAPATAPAWYNIAFALRESGQPEEAVAAYRRYITLRPKDPDPHYGLARALLSLGKSQEALASFRLYTILETRPTERQWVKKARVEIARLENAQRAHAATTAPTPQQPGPAALRAVAAPSSPSPPSPPPSQFSSTGSVVPAQPPPPRQP